MASRHVEYTQSPGRDDPETFVLTISYDRARTSASQLFSTASDFTKGLGTIDGAAATAIDRQLVVSLEAIGFETGSLRTWLSSVIRSLDDEALKSGDVKKVVGAYLVAVKYVALAWLNDDNKQKAIGSLESEIRTLADSTDIRYIPAYSSPSRALLVEGLREVEAAKTSLRDGEDITYNSAAGNVRLLTNIHTDFEHLSDVEVTRRFETNAQRTNLIVKKPDYLGKSQWQVRLGDHTIPAKIADDRWLTQFQGREIPLQPGDALVCNATFITLYDQTGAPVSQSVTVNEIYGVEYQLNPLGTGHLLL